MSAIALYTTGSVPSSNSGGGSGGNSGGSGDSACGHLLGVKQTGRKLGTGLGAGSSKEKKKAAESDSKGNGVILPAEDDSADDVALSPLLSAGLMMDKGKPAKPPVKDMDTEDHELLKKRVQAGAHM